MKKWQRFHVAGKFLAGVSGVSGRSLRSLDFPCSSSLVWCLSGASPEYHRRIPGVSGWPEYPVPVTGISVLSKRPRQVSARARSLRLEPESPVPLTGVSGPPKMCAPCGASLVSVRRLPGRCPESPGLHRSIRPLRPESPVLVAPNGQNLWKGINTPSPLSVS